MYERFTDRSRRVMQLANQEAHRLNHEYIGVDHILLGLAKEGSGVAAHALKSLGVDLRDIRLAMEKISPPGPGGEMIVMGRLTHTPQAKQAIERSIEEARNLNHSYVGTEHVLLGLLGDGESIAGEILTGLGVTLNAVREEVLNLLGKNPKDAVADAPPVDDSRAKLAALKKLVESHDAELVAKVRKFLADV